MTGLRTDPSSITPARSIARSSFRTTWSLTRSSTACHQLLMRNRLETVGDIRLDHPPSAPPGLIDEHLQGIVRGPSRAEPERAVQPCRPRRSARARSSSPPARSGPGPSGSTAAACSVLPGLGMNTRRAGNGRYRPSLSSAATSSRSRATPYSSTIGQGGLVDARRAAVAAHLHPRPPQDVSAVDLVPQRVEPSPGIGLGRPVKRMLQGTDRIRGRPSPDGGTSRNGTHRAPP